jgi:predicted transcriptional regulator
MEVIISCMDSVMTEEENISLKDETKEEIEKFIDSMNSKQFEEVSEFVQNMPQMSYTFNLKCVSCEHEEEKVLRGLDDFF